MAFSMLSTLSAQTTAVKPVYDSILYWQWEPNEDTPYWKLQRRTNRFVYDADKNCLQTTTQLFDLNDSSWYDSELRNYTYDHKGNKLTDALRLKPNVVAWENNVKYVYTYNAQNKVLTFVTQSGTVPADTSVWTELSRNSYSYDSNGNQLTDLYEYKTAGVWEKIRLFTKTYDANNHITFVLDQSWVNNSWSDAAKTTYTYDANGNLLLVEQNEWDGSAWTIRSITTNSYNASNDKIKEIVQLTGGINYTKTESIYNNNHQIIAQFRQNWDQKKWDWVNYWKNDSYEYDVFGNLTELINYRFDKENYWKFSRPTYDYNSDNLLYSTAQRRYNLAGLLGAGDSLHYYFHDFSTGINSVNKTIDNALVYPNPSKGVFTVTLLNNQPVKQIEILNSLGERVLLQSNVNTINLSGLSKGMYFLKIADASQTYLKKVILE